MLQFITHRRGIHSETSGVRAVLEGGCRWIQLRMKGATDNELLSTGHTVSRLCRSFGAVFIVDDRADLVEVLGADGVHLGKNDMPVAEARGILGKSKIIGATANTLDDIRSASAAGADYIGLGPFRFTTTKKGLAPLLGLDGYTRLMTAARAEGITLPVVAIGGITVADLPKLRRTGVSGVAVSGLILTADDKESITKKILESWIN